MPALRTSVGTDPEEDRVVEHQVGELALGDAAHLASRPWATAGQMVYLAT